MELVQAYKSHCAINRLIDDPFQVQVIEELELLSRALTGGAGDKKGIYLWGPIGRGKTMLMDLFYENLEIPLKQRIHFHQLIRFVRDRLAKITGVANPMTLLAAELAPAGSVICIDEFHVSDIDNALVVEMLLKELSSSRTVIVTTSNYSPAEVISDELGNEFQRNNPDVAVETSELFLASKRATLKLLEGTFQAVKIEGVLDYRIRDTSASRWFFDSTLGNATSDLEKRYADFVNVDESLDASTIVFGRPVQCVKRAFQAFWLEYREICEGNFSYRDYLELLQECRLVVLENVDIQTLDGAKRFCWLIEVIYDSGISLAISGRGGQAGLFRAIEIPRRYQIEFQRIKSRVLELTD